ncbi:hypothetical protein K440DRAFT_646743 [Wilcoxina mikolae CBS 423.85]|nr:hypothetical protein K440DRAFT_646743 [Wilcoxina mikolae CBS 423.85]
MVGRSRLKLSYLREEAQEHKTIRNRMGSTSQDNHRFVVGVDFGTAFTSVAFAHSAAPDDVRLVQAWPNCCTGKSSSGQVPSVIRYTNIQTSCRSYQWGYEVSDRDSADSLRWFKLFLQEQAKPIATLPYQRVIHLRDGLGTTSTKPPNSCFNGLSLSNSPAFTPPAITPAQQTARKLQELQISPVTVVSDFLKSVLETTKTSIERTYDVNWVRKSKVEYVLTVPTMWSDSAKALMIEAAERAGFGTHRDDFNLICESESIAADLISYKITAMEPLKLDEIVSGTGDLCGSMFLDQRFEQYIRKLLGDKVIDNMKPRSKHMMMKSWEETVKFTFGNLDAEHEYYVNVPGIRDNEEANVQDGCHTMQSDDVRKIFDPVVDTIIKLVEDQILRVQHKGESVAAIMLSGEFGTSPYLLKQLQNKNFGMRSAPLQVLQPINGRTAVTVQLKEFVNHGAALDYWDSGQNTWRSGYESMGEHMQWDQQTDTWRVKGRLNWFLSKGMVISEKESVSIDLSHAIPDPSVPGDFDFSTPLFACDHSDPPEFIWQNPAAIYQLCTVMKFDSLMDGEVCGEVTAKFGAAEERWPLAYFLNGKALEDSMKYTSMAGTEITEDFLNPASNTCTHKTSPSHFPSIHPLMRAHKF